MPSEPKLEHSYLPFTGVRTAVLEGMTDEHIERLGLDNTELTAKLKNLRDGNGPLLEQYNTIIGLLRSVVATNTGIRDPKKLDERMAVDTRRVSAEYVFERAGCPTWYILPEIMWLLEYARCEARVSDLRIPKGVLRFCFPKPYEFNGIPCRELTIVRYASKPILAIAEELVSFQDLDLLPDSASAYLFTSFGDSIDRPEQYNWDHQDSPVAHFSLKWNDMTIAASVEKASQHPEVTSMLAVHYPDKEREAFAHMIKLVAACLLYVQAEPESVQPVRRSAKGKKVKAPRGGRYIAAVKRLPKGPPAASLGAHLAGERHAPRPHLRSWHLRMLRHKRFERNEDGTPKVILIDSMLVGAKDVADLDAADDRSIVGR